MNTNLFDKTTHIKDLGTLFNNKLPFSQHIQTICSKALKMLEFVKCHTSEFKNISEVKALCKAMVRSQRENCTKIWIT